MGKKGKIKKNSPTAAELFAGVGGFRIGLERSGFNVVYSNQWEPQTKTQHASSVYVKRFGEVGHSNIDIAKVYELPKNIDLIVGGFPCQDYSVAKSLNSAKGLRGKKGVLWWEILRLIKNSKPKYIFLENVDRLLKSPAKQRGRDFAIMLKTLGDLGYFIEWRVVNSAEYGFPQRRIRVFIVAKKISKSSESKLITEKTFYSNSLLNKALPVKILNSNFEVINLDNEINKISSSFNLGVEKSPFKNSGFYFNNCAYTVNLDAKQPKVLKNLKDVLEEDHLVPREYWVEKSKLKEWKFMKGAKSIQRVHKQTGTIYKYEEGKMSFPDDINKPSRTILTGEGGSTPSRFKHIIKTNKGYRRLLPVELERLNGFPDNWTKFGSNNEIISDTKRAFFMGNALVVGLVEKVGKAIADDLEIKC